MRFYEITLPSPIGPLRLVASDSGLRSVLMQNERPNRVRVPSSIAKERNPILDRAERELGEYFAGARTEFSIPLEMEGTEFEKKVWRGLLTIPYGATYYYGQLADQIGHPQGARAVGRANGLNPLSIVVPCHRVIGKSGALVGFAGGLDVKAFLLQLESERSMVPPPPPAQAGDA